LSLVGGALNDFARHEARSRTPRLVRTVNKRLDPKTVCIDMMSLCLADNVLPANPDGTHRADQGLLRKTLKCAQHSIIFLPSPAAVRRENPADVDERLSRIGNNFLSTKRCQVAEIRFVYLLN
jgi:hypothetical protein